MQLVCEREAVCIDRGHNKKTYMLLYKQTQCPARNSDVNAMFAKTLYKKTNSVRAASGDNRPQPSIIKCTIHFDLKCDLGEV